MNSVRRGKSWHVTSREAIEWLELPRYNGVYISGATSDGVLNLVKRTGTAGDVLAPMVSDPLNTHADASRQRGLAVLALWRRHQRSAD